MKNVADGCNLAILAKILATESGTYGIIHASGTTTDGAEMIGGADQDTLPGDMSGTLASASGYFAATLATIGATTLAKIGATTHAPKEPDVSGTIAFANGSQKFGTPNAADGRESETLALILTDQEEEHVLQIQEEEMDAAAAERPKAASEWQATSIKSS